jgi:hypothetical protein
LMYGCFFITCFFLLLWLKNLRKSGNKFWFVKNCFET